jgi:hypothetical protein
MGYNTRPNDRHFMTGDCAIECESVDHLRRHTEMLFAAAARERDNEHRIAAID